MAQIVYTDPDWTKGNRDFTIIRANVDTLSMDILDNKLGSLYKIRCDSITEWINMAGWNDVAWMIWINNNKPVVQ
jgi:hypothetical protein